MNPEAKRFLRAVEIAAVPLIMAAAAFTDPQRPTTAEAAPIQAQSLVDENCPNPPNRYYLPRRCFIDAAGNQRLWGVRLGFGIAPNPSDMSVDTIDDWIINGGNYTYTNSLQPKVALYPNATWDVSIGDLVVDPSLDGAYLLTGISPQVNDNHYVSGAEYFNLTHAITDPRDLSTHFYINGLPQGGTNGINGYRNTMVEMTDQAGKYLEVTQIDSSNSSEDGKYQSRLSSTGSAGTFVKITAATNTPTPSPSLSLTPSPDATPTRTVTTTPSRTATITFTPTPTATSGSIDRAQSMGDANGDGMVNILDFGLLSANYGTLTNCTSIKVRPCADFNGDGMVNILDFGTLSFNYGKDVRAFSATATLTGIPTIITATPTSTIFN